MRKNGEKLQIVLVMHLSIVMEWLSGQNFPCKRRVALLRHVFTAGLSEKERFLSEETGSSSLGITDFPQNYSTESLNFKQLKNHDMSVFGVFRLKIDTTY